MSLRFRDDRAYAFTLVEVLSVLAVAIVLFSILIPVVGNMRSSANTTSCVSNLRQLGVGTSIYMIDNGNVYPSKNFWPKEIGAYVEAPWTGETNPLSDKDNPFMCPSADRGDLSSSYNHQLAYGINADSVAGRTLEQIVEENPARKANTMILYSDAIGVNLWNWTPERIATGRHPEGVNAVYADFHVEKTGVDRQDHPDIVSLFFLEGFRKSE